MATFIGADWAGRGWLTVVLEDDNSWEADLYPTVWSLWKAHSDADRILIDVPIGLPRPEDGPRAADRTAKQRLGPRQSSVFYTPSRAAVYETNIETAKRIHANASYSIQNQAWGIVGRIREVDEFLDRYPVATDRLFETHPEVCFRELDGSPLEHPKHTDAGVDERLGILTDEPAPVRAIYDELREEFTTPSYAPLVSNRHDLLDALVAAITARRPADSLGTLPEAPPTDARGLPMRIVYPSTTVQATLPTD